MDASESAVLAEWTHAIYNRLLIQWEAWKRKDKPANDAVIADGFESYRPDGTRQSGRPLAREMADQPISGYSLAEFRVVPVAADAALVTYVAGIDTPDGSHHRMAVGEYWFLRNGDWFIRGFSGTLVS